VLTVTVKGNKVSNGDFEQPNDTGDGPADWTPSDTEAGRTSWSPKGSDGSMAAKITGTGGSALIARNAVFKSKPISVVPGQVVDLVASVQTSNTSSHSAVGLAYLGETGQVHDTVRLLTAPLSTDGFVNLERTVTIPVGVAEVQVLLIGFSPTDAATAGSVVFDDVGLFET
jgi:hypothetical protein